MRGEGRIPFNFVCGLFGSSPHARGGRADANQCGSILRLIPACAGRAPAGTSAARGTWAHPRMRGEGLEGDYGAGHTGGSSPHARGGLSAVHDTGRLVRLIPACAGRACGTGSRPRSRGAHPRMRGEGRTAPRTPVTTHGSSPHARGGLHVLRVLRLGRRLIPACAGRAGRSTAICSWPTAHPRMRGEGEHRQNGRTGERGSSPHARGGQALIAPDPV